MEIWTETKKTNLLDLTPTIVVGPPRPWVSTPQILEATAHPASASCSNTAQATTSIRVPSRLNLQVLVPSSWANLHQGLGIEWPICWIDVWENVPSVIISNVSLLLIFTLVMKVACLQAFDGLFSLLWFSCLMRRKKKCVSQVGLALNLNKGRTHALHK